jgi:hypothetical protein
MFCVSYTNFRLLDEQQLKTKYGEPFICLQVKRYSKRYLTLAVYNLLCRTHEYLNTALNSLILSSDMYPYSFFIVFRIRGC